MYGLVRGSRGCEDLGSDDDGVGVSGHSGTLWVTVIREVRAGKVSVKGEDVLAVEAEGRGSRAANDCAGAALAGVSRGTAAWCLATRGVLGGGASLRGSVQLLGVLLRVRMSDILWLLQGCERPEAIGGGVARLLLRWRKESWNMLTTL